MKRAAQLRIDEKIEGPDRILSFQGSADILSMPAVQELLSRYSKEDVRLLVIDLSETVADRVGVACINARVNQNSSILINAA